MDGPTMAGMGATGLLGAGLGGALARTRGRNVPLSALWIGAWSAGSAAAFSGECMFIFKWPV